MWTVLFQNKSALFQMGLIDSKKISRLFSVKKKNGKEGYKTENIFSPSICWKMQGLLNIMKVLTENCCVLLCIICTSDKLHAVKIIVPWK